MITRLFFALTILFSGTFLCAQFGTTSTPILKSSDVENFIKHYPSIEVELEKLDLDIDPQDDMEALTEGLESYEEINEIVQKYGYANYFDFAAKAGVIATCYASLKLEGEGVPEIQQAYDKIDNDASMTAEQKQMAKQQLEMILSAMGGSFTSMANEQDIKTVEAFVDKLDILFDEE